ncbi:kelch domain-containing protein 10-like [Oculina patagonica]
MASKKIETVIASPNSQIPEPRSGHRCGSDDGNIYVFGGYSPHYDDYLFRELWCFNIATKMWHLLQTTGPFPTEVASSCLVLDKGNLIVFGGSGVPFGMCNSKKLHICSLKKLQWFDLSERYSDKEESDGEDISPIAGYGQSMVLSRDKELYVFGGTTGLEFNSYLYRYSLFKHTWEYLKGDNPPVPRYRHESVCDGERFYVIGGGMSSRDPQEFFQLEKINSFSFASRRWNEHACHPSKTHGFPKRRRCHGCVIFDSIVYICGGYDGVNIFDDIWSLDLSTFQWEKLPKVLPYCVYFHSATVTPSGCMYVFGGVKTLNSSEDTRSNDIFKLWLTCPPLAERCWEVITNGLQRKITFPTDLKKLGIPQHFLDRLK